MERRIIIGRNNKDYYYSIRERLNETWIVIESKDYNAEESIRDLLNIEIETLKYFNNLLFVKTNDDLVVVENYSQLNHDKVFKSFNERVKKKLINTNLMNKQKALQKKSNHKKAIISSKVICMTAIISAILLSSSLTIEGDGNIGMTPIATKQWTGIKQKDGPYIKAPNIVANPILSILTTSRKVPVIPKTNPEEEYFQNKIKEYSGMYNIDEKRALQLIVENEEKIKTEYVNQEVGIIRVFALEMLNDPNISKEPEVSDVSALEREKLLLQFAKIHEITDADTLATMIAIHRLETGNGSSDACIYQNNFGGLRYRNSQTGKYYVLSFKTPQIGAEAFVSNFLKMKEAANNSKYYNPSRSLEVNMNHIYCGEGSWPTKVQELKQEVINEYNLNEYICEEKPKQLIR